MEVERFKHRQLAPTMGPSSRSSSEFEGPINNTGAVSCKPDPLFRVRRVPALLDGARQNPTGSRLIKFDTITRSRKKQSDKGKSEAAAMFRTADLICKDKILLFPFWNRGLSADVHQNSEGPLKTEFESQAEASSGSYSIQSQHQYSRAKPNWLVEA
jgi:hypothetical protein